MSVEAAVEVRSLRHEYNGTVALEGVNLTVAPGEMLGIVGPDGAGKTTLLRVMAGILPPTAGRVRVLGIDVGSQPERVKAHLGYVAQGFALYGDLSVEENLRFCAEVHGLARREFLQRAEELLAISELAPFRRRLARDLSGGMQRKLALCCALLHRPAVLLLDEPTLGLDPLSRRSLWSIVQRLPAQGVTILASTTYMEEAERCTRVAIMHQGRLLACDTVPALKAAFPYRLLEISGEGARLALKRLRALPGVHEAHEVGAVVHAAVEPSLMERWTLEGLEGLRVREIEPSLEDVFVVMSTQEPPPCSKPATMPSLWSG